MENVSRLACCLLLLCYSSILPTCARNVEVFQIVPDKVTENSTYKIYVDLLSSLSECETRFLSVTIDTYSVKTRWKQFNFQSQKFQNLAAALAPMDVRLGGTYSDFLIFDPNGTDSFEDKQAPEIYGDGFKFDSGFFESPFQLENFTLSGKHWDIVNTFLGKVGWDLMFDFNLFKWKGSLWDPTNAELLLNYSSERGFKIPYFQLGNEPNSYLHNFNLTVSPKVLAEDYRILKSVIAKYPLYNTSGLYGPDVTNLNVPHGSVQYLTDFLLSGAYNVIAGVSLHHYYLNSRTATQDQFVNLTVLNSLKSQLQLALDVITSCPVPLPVLLTETSSCFGGGAANLSNSYLAGFLWLDKLGLSAQYGVSRVFRQTFLGGTYGLLDQNMNPNPDYYLSLLFKRLVEGPVFSVFTEPSDPQLRVYAHCARRNIYQAGDLVIYYLNIKDTEINLDLPQFQNADLELYLLTPGDEAGLRSRYVRLNGDLLLLTHSTLPPLTPKPHRGPVTVSPMSFGFIVVPNFSVSLCLKYFARSANQG